MVNARVERDSRGGAGEEKADDAADMRAELFVSEHVFVIRERQVLVTAAPQLHEVRRGDIGIFQFDAASLEEAANGHPKPVATSEDVAL